MYTSIYIYIYTYESRLLGDSHGPRRVPGTKKRHLMSNQSLLNLLKFPVFIWMSNHIGPSC